MIFRREFLKSTLFLCLPKRKQRTIQFDTIEKYNLATFEHTRFTYEIKEILLKTEYIEPIILRKGENMINGWHQIRSKQCPGD